ncbi:uncharacterized protein LOC141595030 [Silene latifolia]|uniref:uncharacterized protein LOC141595030 n=1 Tax=Silene latifolia TaxID=37657 RepID=UPI003D76AB8F
MICQDLIRLYERPNATPRCMFKIDLQKAYDTVKWAFVDQLLDMLRFPADFKTMVMQCITTATFSLSVNGDMFGTLKYVAARYNFHYHPLCKQQKLASLMFADDFLLFSRGDTESMMLLLRSFSTFSKAFGLKVSAPKSNAYFKGVPDHIKQNILSVSSRINDYGARKFSYSGRLVLVQAVLSSLHSYWASMFVLPKGIIARIEATCRNFLWNNSADYRRVLLVAWDKVCRPKEEGGLGLKDQEAMNKAMVGSLVNWVAEQKNTIWVNWVQQNYLKGKDWMDYKPTTNSSWVWRRICRVKQELLLGYINGQWDVQGKEFSTVGCYEWLKGSKPKVPWARLIWNAWVVPKHQFLGWLFAHGALRTNDKLVHKQVICCINQKLNCQFPDSHVLDWCLQRTGTKLQMVVHAVVVWGAMYHIWQERNRCRIDGVITRPGKCSEQIIEEVKARIRGRDFQHVTKAEINWLRQKNLYVMVA